MPEHQLKLTSSLGAHNAIIEYLGHGFDEGPGDAFVHVKPRQIFNFDVKNKTVELGGVPIQVPEFVDVLPNPGIELKYGCEESVALVTESLAASTGMSASYGCFHASLKANYAKSTSNSQDSLYAYLFASFQLADFCINSNDPAYLSKGFLDDLAALPDSVSEKTIEKFIQFFDDYGIYYVDQITAGGRLHIYNAVSRYGASTTENASVDIRAQYDGLFTSGSFNTSVATTESWKNFSQKSETIIDAKGGSAKAQGALIEIDPKAPGKDTSVAIFDNWAGSLVQDSAVSKTRVSPISNLCGAKRTVVAAAAAAYMSSIKFRTITEPSYDWMFDFHGNIYLNGAEVIITEPTNHGGYHVVVYDRADQSSLLLNKFYPLDPAQWQTDYPAMYDRMADDLNQPKLKDSRNTVIIRSSNLPIGCVPTENFRNYLLGSLDLPQKAIDDWKEHLNYTSFTKSKMPFYVVGRPNNSSGSTYFCGYVQERLTEEDTKRLSEILVTTLLSLNNNSVEVKYYTSYFGN